MTRNKLLRRDKPLPKELVKPSNSCERQKDEASQWTPAVHDVIDQHLVKTLIADQFPKWRDLPITPIAKQGWDNRTFRLGDTLSVRVPSGPEYASAVAKETEALAALKGHLPVEIPEVVAIGTASKHCPLPWSVRKWIEGETLETASKLDRPKLVQSLAQALLALQSAPPSQGRMAGPHSFYRGCHPSVYADQVEKALSRLGDKVDAAKCRQIWHQAITTVWTKQPVWFHGDLAPGNILIKNGTLSAVIDFGTCGIGDPACDLAIAWTILTPNERAHLRTLLPLEDDTWHRAKGWVLWKALVTLSDLSSPDQNGRQAATLAQLLQPQS